MGDSNYGGNGSVHWSINHQNGHSLTIRRNDSARPTSAGRSNVHQNKCKLQGRDPRGDARPSTSRCASNRGRPDPIEQLEKALKDAQANSGEKTFFVTFRVPATVEGKRQKKPGQKPSAERRVHW